MAPTRIPIKLYNVRLDYPCLFEHNKFEAVKERDPKYTTKIILNKVRDMDQINKINASIDDILNAEKWSRDNSQICCFRDGNFQQKPEFKDSFILTGKSVPKVPVYNTNDKTFLTKEDKLIYGGCYVDIEGFFRTSVSTSNWVCFDLSRVRFVSHGEKFGTIVVTLPEVDGDVLRIDNKMNYNNNQMKTINNIAHNEEAPPFSADDYDF